MNIVEALESIDLKPGCTYHLSVHGLAVELSVYDEDHPEAKTHVIVHSLKSGEFNAESRTKPSRIRLPPGHSLRVRLSK